jgi:serine/threonine-protein kinase
MATVYRGVYESGFGFRRTVAVKVFDVIASDEYEVVLSALTDAARRSAAVSHPNVVRIEDFGLLAPAQPYALQELVEGCTLGALASSRARRRERLPPDVALFIGIEIAEALAGARLACSPDGVRFGVVHAELSTSDVLLSWHGEVKVSDFGFGAAARAASSVRSIRALARRVRALAPEVARGQRGDARSDVFSVGVILREMLVGPRFPPTVTEAEALVLARDGVVHQAMFEPHLPAELQAILARALERDPQRRYPHAGALAYELRRVALTMGVGDGRTFLRTLLARTFGDEDEKEELEMTTELTMPIPRPSGVATIDRFARLRGESSESRIEDTDPEGFESGTLPISGLAEEEDDAAEG